MTATILKLERTTPALSPIKIESLDWNRAWADQVEKSMRDFIEKFSFDRAKIEGIECRSRDGFFPFSHNKGGLEAVAYQSQDYCHSNGPTGFYKADEILEKYCENDRAEFLKNLGKTWDQLSEDEIEQFYNARSEDDSTIQFMLRLMVNDENTLTVSIFVNASDTPYHRGHDDYFEHEIKFRTISGLERKLKALINKPEFKRLEKCVRNSY